MKTMIDIILIIKKLLNAIRKFTSMTIDSVCLPEWFVCLSVSTDHYCCLLKITGVPGHIL